MAEYKKHSETAWSWSCTEKVTVTGADGKPKTVKCSGSGLASSKERAKQENARHKHK